MRPTKIVVVGDPHSGKSVFLNGLFQNLPWDKRFIFRACPDGEGMWTWRGNGSEQYRIKGKFTPEMVNWYCEALANCAMAPIVLVDVGGIPSEENRRILIEGGVNFGIILCGDASRIPVWEEFLTSCGVGVLARVHSDYRGETDVPTGNILSVHYLDREADVISRPTILAVAETIKGIADLSEGGNGFLNDDILELSQVGKAIGKTEETVVRSGKESKQIVWRGSDLKKIAALIQNALDYLPSILRVNGFATAFVICALANLLRSRKISVNSPDEYVTIGCNPPSGKGSGIISFQTAEEENGWTRVSFQLDPSSPLKPTDLNNIAPPELPNGSKIILSGRGPNWLFASLAMAYRDSAKAIACFQPGIGSTVAITSCTEVKLGDLIPLT